MKKLITQKFINELVEKTALAEMIKREKKAETKMMIVLEEISIALRKKGVKKINGANFTLELP